MSLACTKREQLLFFIVSLIGLFNLPYYGTNRSPGRKRNNKTTSLSSRRRKVLNESTDGSSTEIEGQGVSAPPSTENSENVDLPKDATSE